MINPRALSTVFSAVSLTLLAPGSGNAQHAGHHGSSLYVAALEAKQVVPAATNDANGTAVFMLKGDGGRYSLSYDLTYQALLRPPARIVLRNFGEGGVGKVVHVVCGGDAPRCPQQTDATLKGEWTDRHPQLPLTAPLTREIAVARVYAEIEDDAGQGVVRGQVITYDSMMPVQAFVVRLNPPGGGAGGDAASGTGAFYLADKPDGGQSMIYRVTSARTDGTPTKIVIARGAAQAGGQSRMVLEAMPRDLAPRISAERPAGRGQKGGTISGSVLPPQQGTVEVFAAHRLAAPAAPDRLSVTITTDANPAGELVGDLIPVE